MNTNFGSADTCMTRKRNALRIFIFALINASLLTSLAMAETRETEHHFRLHCSKRTEDAWNKEFGRSGTKTNDKRTVHRHKDYYNAQLKQCFYLTRSDVIEKGQPIRIETLFNVDENKEYGMFTRGSEDDRVFCILYVDRSKRCGSEDEWHDFVAAYIEK